MYVAPSKRNRLSIDLTTQSGNILEVAKDYKTLFERSKQKDLGLTEKFLMEGAEKMLLGELKYAKNITYENSLNLRLKENWIYLNQLLR